jgi:hypothetical protein
VKYNYFRDYDPALGRYIESDPIGLSGGINTYLYGHAAPIRRIDPSGLWSGADAGLFGHFYGGRGQYANISAYCNDYLSDPMVLQQTNMMENRVKNETRNRAGSSGSSSFSISQSSTLYITTIYSFGAGTGHRQRADCQFTGDGCCGTSTCTFSYYAVDRFDDPLDLCQSHGMCGSGRNVGGTPFWFGLSCSKSFSTRACRS